MLRYLPAALSMSLCLSAQDTAPANEKIFDRIRIQAYEHSQVMASLQHLCDRIGPRLTGSEQMAEANRWTEEKFKSYGLRSWREAWEIENGWSRVAAKARLVEPVQRELRIAAGGWTPSTPGSIRAEIVDFTRPRRERDQREGSMVGGRILLTGRTPRVGRAVDDPFAGCALRLLDSQKPHSLLNMTRLNSGGPYAMGRTPAAFIVSEDFKLIQRLLDGNEQVIMEAEIKTEFRPGPVEVHNTVAELEGSDLKEEIVVAGAHLDSWDLGSGTTDNGTGSMVVLEAARILAGLGKKPRRTIRFILFSGEEQGLNGSKQYVKAHADEMDKHVAGLVMDIGTGSLWGLSLHNQAPFYALSEDWFEPVRDLNFDASSMRRQGGSDHLSFQAAGVPAFAFIQDPVEYGLTHHTQSDTYDKAVAENLMQAATVMATGLWSIANHEGDLPRFDPKLEADLGGRD
ncbi:MAG: M20/M25/M40 family metallo-hydrolase [Planctomycetota bacterium]|jgi:hypothetical protein